MSGDLTANVTTPNTSTSTASTTPVAPLIQPHVSNYNSRVNTNPLPANLNGYSCVLGGHDHISLTSIYVVY